MGAVSSPLCSGIFRGSYWNKDISKTAILLLWHQTRLRWIAQYSVDDHELKQFDSTIKFIWYSTPGLHPIRRHGYKCVVPTFNLPIRLNDALRKLIRYKNEPVDFRRSILDELLLDLRLRQRAHRPHPGKLWFTQHKNEWVPRYERIEVDIPKQHSELEQD
jgi:hypothetical protein